MRTRLAAVLLAIALVSAMVVSTPVAARAAAGDAADEDVVIDGGGWGHGVGMSQYGAWGMSVLGTGRGGILSHYFQGATLGKLGPNIGDIWVNLERNFTSLTLRVEAVGNATASPVTVSHPWRSVTAEVGATLKLFTHGALGCRVVVHNPGVDPVGMAMRYCRIDFQWYDWTDATLNPTTKLVIDGCTLANWNTTPTSHPECQYARGTMHLRAGADGLDLSAQMDLEDYVLGISEMPYYWADQGGAEALRAQAIAARSYAREQRLARGSQLATNGCDGWCHVRDTTADQRYVGWGHGNADWVDAVRDTEDVVVVHDDAPNRVVRTYYFSSSAGVTEDGAERWGLTPRQYYTSVSDAPAVDGTVANPNAAWTEVIPASEMAAAVGFDTLTAVSVSEVRPFSESAAMVRYEGIVAGEAVVVQHTGTWTRTTFGLKSEFFTVDFTSAAPSAAPTCVEAQPGDGWWSVTVRLGLPGPSYEQVRQANPDAENAAGNLVAGAEVCAPGATLEPEAGGVPLPAATTCTIVGSGEGWWAQAVKLGLSGAQWPLLQAANSGVTTTGGQLRVGATVCMPGEDVASLDGGAATCTTSQPGEGWIAVGSRLGWPVSQWRLLADANTGATSSSGNLVSGAEVCLP